MASSADARWQAPRRPATRTAPLRHAFATHLLESGYDIRTVQERKQLRRDQP